tara:strand:- start:52 stop:765 length:714 start_codon:yes stop_codon:yes gene_type:complete
VYTYNIGGYDPLTFTRVPRDIDAFFFTIEGEITHGDRQAAARQGWNVVFVDKSEQTPYVDANRLTSKRLKWASSALFSDYHFVLTHDANVTVDYSRLRGFIRRHATDDSVVLKNWEHRTSGNQARVFSEINDMLERRKQFVTTSREQVIAWRDALLRDDTYDTAPYFETDIFLFRPDCARYRAFGDDTYRYCHSIQRDQFVVPYMLQKRGVRNKALPVRVWSNELGYRKKILHLKRN